MTEVSKIGFFHFAADDGHADPVRKLTAELRKNDHSGSLIVLPEAFNIGCRYYDPDPTPNTDPSVIDELRSSSESFDTVFVAGLIIQTCGSPQPPYSGAFLVDADGWCRLCYKRCKDSSPPETYQACPQESDSHNGIKYANLALGAMICMDNFTYGARTDQNATQRHSDLRRKLEMFGNQRVVYIPALARDGGEFCKPWPNTYVVLANGYSSTTGPNSFIAKTDNDGHPLFLVKFSDEANAVLTHPIS